MGNWNISIRGIGAHHNDNNPADADKMARRFVQELLDAGHTITGAEITHGGATVFVGAPVTTCGSPGAEADAARTEKTEDTAPRGEK